MKSQHYVLLLKVWNCISHLSYCYFEKVFEKTVSLFILTYNKYSTNIPSQIMSQIHELFYFEQVLSIDSIQWYHIKHCSWAHSRYAIYTSISHIYKTWLTIYSQSIMSKMSMKMWHGMDCTFIIIQLTDNIIYTIRVLRLYCKQIVVRSTNYVNELFDRLL